VKIKCGKNHIALVIDGGVCKNFITINGANNRMEIELNGHSITNAYKYNMN
jgi:hypothetical protein